MPLTAAEQAELAATPELIGQRNADGSFAAGVMVVPRRSGDYNEQLAAFAKLQFMDHDATPDEIQTFVSGQKSPTPHDAPPVDEWANDVDPTPPATNQSPTPTPTPQPATPPQAPVAKPPAPKAPRRMTDDEVRQLLGPEYQLLQVLPCGQKAVCLWRDPSYPREAPKQVTIDLAKHRKRKRQEAQAAMRLRGPSNDVGRQLKF
jgi:hypothetical protein